MASSPSSSTSRLVRAAGAALGRWLSDAGRGGRPARAGGVAPRRDGGQRRGGGRAQGRGGGGLQGRTAYPGDFEGRVATGYDPHPDGRPDPGEVVWTWVPYEEDHSQGKDRPVLLVGRDGPWLLALPLTSRDHDRDAEQESRAGRSWVDIGSGAWDRQGRPSEARVDRVLRVDPVAVRREGAVLPRERFTEVEAALRARGL